MEVSRTTFSVKSPCLPVPLHIPEPSLVSLVIQSHACVRPQTTEILGICDFQLLGKEFLLY